METKDIKIGGWTGKPSKNIGNGYDLYDARNEYRGWCPESKIVEHLNEMSGENFRALPAVKPSELRREVGEKIRSGIAGQWYRHTRYFKGEQLLGTIQTRQRYYGRRIGSRIETHSCAKNAAVMGSSLSFICEQNGLRLIEE